ncbi:hypothetical protein AAF712_005697 [Marasmius tenuissimus]|uniref:Uncharacterized protein n=1 Tax=Marasmius tenuissimus TaxID=585030 RepID=A0ABR3A2Q0_9AGAR
MDVKAGAYQIYLQSENKTCPDESRRTLLPDVQSAVCNSGIKIFKGLYDKTVWDTGAFYFIYTRDELTKESIAQGDGAFSCPNPLSSLSSSASSATPTFSPTSDTQTEAAQTQSISGGTIAGIVIGCLAALLVGFLVGWLLRRRGQRVRRENVRNVAESTASKFVGSRMVATPSPAPFHSPVPRPRQDNAMWAPPSVRRTSDILNVDSSGHGDDAVSIEPPTEEDVERRYYMTPGASRAERWVAERGFGYSKK